MTAASPADPTAVLGRRIGAFLVDLVIVAAVAVLSARFVADFQRETIPAAFAGRDDVCDIVEQSQTVTMCFTNDDVVYYATGTDAEASMVGLPILVSFLNSVVLAAATGATVGKHAFGLRVVRDGTFAPAGIGRHVVRWALWIVDAFPWFVPLVGLVAALVTPRHRRVGDRVAGTAVVARSAVGRPVAVVADDEPMAAWPSSPVGPDATAELDPWAIAGPLYPPIIEVPPVDEPMFDAADVKAAPPVDDPVADLPTTGPQWDAARNAYIQWEPVSGQWMQYDDSAATWRPLS